MPNVNVQFLGQTLILPGAYYADNVSAVVQGGPPTAPPLIFVGYGFGGAPFSINQFASAQDLYNFLRGGPCAAFVPFLATPSPSLNGAGLITYINASENTKSSLTLMTSGGTPSIALTSTNYGPPSNLLQATVAAGTTAGTKITLTDTYAGTSAFGDNLGIPFQMAYTGTATGGISYAVNATGFIVTSPNAGESYTVPIGASGYATISQVVQYIQGQLATTAKLLSSTNGQSAASGLTVTATTALTPPVSGAPQYANINATVNDPVFWVNQFASNYATAVIGSGAANTLTYAPAVAAPTFFSGAVGVPPTNNDYATALNVALTQPGWCVFIDSNATAVQALGTQHAITASSITYGMWRRFFTGSSIGDTITTTVQNAIALDSIETCYVYPGIYRTNTATGATQLYGGLYGAAAAAGMAAGNIIATPLTNKPLIGSGVEVPLTISQINVLQEAGVMCVAIPPSTPGVPTIVSDLTVWQVDNNPENTFTQQVACRFWLAYTMVNTLQPYVGTIASTITETTILNAVKAALNALIYTGGSSNGVINSWDKTSLKLVYSGAQQLAAISVNVTLVGQNRFITCYVPIQPLNIVISASS